MGSAAEAVASFQMDKAKDLATFRVFDAAIGIPQR
jgi:hypothetical protein